MRPEKSFLAAELREQISRSRYMILTSYRGMTVAQLEELRGRLTGARARMQVVKNRLLARAAKEEGLGINGGLRGPTAIVVGDGEIAEIARILREYAQKQEVPEFKLGFLNGRRLSAAQLEELAQLPPRPVMLGQLLGLIQAPARNLAGVLYAKLASLVYVLQAAADAKRQGED